MPHVDDVDDARYLLIITQKGLRLEGILRNKSEKGLHLTKVWICKQDVCFKPKLLVLWEDIKDVSFMERVGQEAAPLQMPTELAEHEDEPLFGTPVLLHVYDCGQARCMQVFNKALTQVGIGGAYHAAVEVNGLEWDFDEYNTTTPAVHCREPRQNPYHHFRTTVALGYTQRSAADVADIISQLLEEYRGEDYDLFSRNCCHFADDFVRRLGLDGIPGWVSLRLAACAGAIGACMASVSPFGAVKRQWCRAMRQLDKAPVQAVRQCAGFQAQAHFARTHGHDRNEQSDQVSWMPHVIGKELGSDIESRLAFKIGW